MSRLAAVRLACRLASGWLRRRERFTPRDTGFTYPKSAEIKACRYPLSDPCLWLKIAQFQPVCKTVITMFPPLHDSTVSNSPPTTTAMDSRGAKPLDQLRARALRVAQCGVTRLAGCFVKLANEGKRFSRGPAAGTCGQVPFVLSYVSGVKKNKQPLS